MDDIGVMKKINSFADLINNISLMLLLKNVSFPN